MEAPEDSAEDAEPHEITYRSEIIGVRHIKILGNTTFSNTESKAYVDGKVVSQRTSQRKSIKTKLSENKYRLDSVWSHVITYPEANIVPVDNGQERTYSEIYEILEDGTEVVIESTGNTGVMTPVPVKSTETIFSDGSKISTTFADKPYQYKSNGTMVSIQFENSSCYFERIK